MRSRILAGTMETSGTNMCVGGSGVASRVYESLRQRRIGHRFGNTGALFQASLLLGLSSFSLLTQFTDVLPVRDAGYTCIDVVQGDCWGPLRGTVLGFGAVGPLGVFLLGELTAGFPRGTGVRRGLHRWAMHLFGLSVTLLGCSVLQCVSGLHRPFFLHVCFPQGLLNASCKACPCSFTKCSNSDSSSVRHASRSFPSTSSALAAYVALAIAKYVHFKLWTPNPLGGPALKRNFASVILLVA